MRRGSRGKLILNIVCVSPSLQIQDIIIPDIFHGHSIALCLRTIHHLTRSSLPPPAREFVVRGGGGGKSMFGL